MRKIDTEELFITDKNQLLSLYQSGIKAKSDFRIGIEQEKIGIYKDSLQSANYSGENGVLAFLKRFKNTDKWQYWPDENKILGLSDEIGMITLEPGSQLELSTVPQNNIHEIKTYFDQYTKLTSEIATEFGIRWLGYGIQPLSVYENIEQIPKERYDIMAEYLPTKATMPLVMMRETAGVQTALDYDSEQDCMNKLKIGLAISPIVTAMFANSPIRGGIDTGYKSYRALSWLNVDNDRCGLISKKIFENSKNDLSFQDYADVLLDMPMVFLNKHDEWHNMKGLSFRNFVKHGFEGHQATVEDWNLHMSSFFPEIRLKNYLELRNCDCQRKDLILALPALWKGLLYNEAAIEATWSLVKTFKWEEVQELRNAVPKLALDAEIKNKKISYFAKELIKISMNSLDVQAKEKNILSESIYLEPLKRLVDKSMTPADQILELWNKEWNKDLRKLVNFCELK